MSRGRDEQHLTGGSLEFGGGGGGVVGVFFWGGGGSKICLKNN